MFDKITLLRAATALLYLGPLLAGLGGFGWGLVPVFVLLFVLWLIFLRPESWPGTNANWRNGRSWLTLVSRGLVQALIVSILFGIGRGLGGVVGFPTAIPLWLPVLLSTAAILLGRLIWNPAEARQPPGKL